MLELHAAYFVFYQVDRASVEYILSTFRCVDDQPLDFNTSPTYIQRILKLYDEFSAKVKSPSLSCRWSSDFASRPRLGPPDPKLSSRERGT